MEFYSFEDAVKFIIKNKSELLKDAKAFKAVYSDVASVDIKSEVVLIDRVFDTNIIRLFYDEKDYDILYKKCMRELTEKAYLSEKAARKILRGFRFLCEDGGMRLLNIIDKIDSNITEKPIRNEDSRTFDAESDDIEKAVNNFYIDEKLTADELYDLGSQSTSVFGSFEGFCYMKKAAEMGHTKARDRLGSYYKSGEFTKSDIKKAAYWYGEAAKAGLPEAQYHLGGIYTEANDIHSAIYWLEKAAQSGYENAQHTLGGIYFENNNIDEAIKWLSAAAETGNLGAMFDLAEVYTSPKNKNPDYTKAINIYKETLSKYDTGYIQLADLYLEKILKDNKLGMYCLEKTAMLLKSDGKYQLILAVFYYEGKVTERNYYKSLYWCNRARKNGVALAEAFYRNKLRNVKGPTTPKEYFEKANRDFETSNKSLDEKLKNYIYWLNIAAMENYADAQYALGLCCYTGKGVKQNLNEAFRYFSKAEKNGNREACAYLGNCLYKGEGTEKNIAEAVGYLEKAAISGNADAQYNLANCLLKEENKDIEKGVFWLKKAAESGVASAMLDLSSYYLKGTFVEKNYDMAYSWARKADNAGSEDTYEFITKEFQDHDDLQFGDYYYDTAIKYINGNGKPKDEKKGFELLKLAAERDHVISQTLVGDYYLYGTIPEKDFNQSFYWYNKAAEQGYALAQNNLGMQYLNGEGVEKDTEKAMELFKKAASQGMITAERNYAACLLGMHENSTTPERVKEGLNIYKKLAERGDDESREYLNKLSSAFGDLGEDAKAVFDGIIGKK